MPRLKTSSGQRGRGRAGRGARGGTTLTPSRGSGRGVRRGGGRLTGPPPVAGGNVNKGRGRGNRGGGGIVIPPHLMRGGPRGSGRTRAASKSVADIMKELVGAANQSPPAAFNPGDVVDTKENEETRSEPPRVQPEEGDELPERGAQGGTKRSQRRGQSSQTTLRMNRWENPNQDPVMEE